jgi:hypothetical protein
VFTSFLGSACAKANPHDNAQQIVVIRMIRITTSAWLIVPNRLDRLQFHVVIGRSKLAANDIRVESK